jgi:hypothetical protein
MGDGEENYYVTIPRRVLPLGVGSPYPLALARMRFYSGRGKHRTQAAL